MPPLWKRSISWFHGTRTQGSLVLIRCLFLSLTVNWRSRLNFSELFYLFPFYVCHTEVRQWGKNLLPHRVAFLRRFGLKTGIHFAPFGLESGMVFEGTTGVHERIYRFNSVWVRKKEKYANRNEFEQFQVSPSNPSNDNIISAWTPGLKTGMDFRGLVWKRVWKITFFVLK